MQNKPLHRFLAWTFLVLFTYNSIGSQIFTVIWKWHTKEKLETLAKNLDTEYLTAIAVNGTIEDSEEIFSKGHWYDVIRVQKNGNNTICYCIPDFTEDLIQNTAKTGLIDDLHKQYNDVLKLAKKAVAVKCLIENVNIKTTASSFFEAFEFNQMKETVKTGYLTINAQPPEKIC